MIDVFRRISKPVVFAASLGPLAVMGWNAWANPNAIYFNGIVRNTGFWSLRFLCLTLAITPLRWLTGWHWLMKFRLSLAKSHLSRSRLIFSGEADTVPVSC